MFNNRYILKTFSGLACAALALSAFSCSDLDRANPQGSITAWQATKQPTASSSMIALDLSSSMGSFSSSVSSSSSDVDSLTVVWDGAKGRGTVETGGYWFSYDDSNEPAYPNSGPGASTSNFPAPTGIDDVVGKWASDNGGLLNISFSLNATSYKYPVAGVGFNWTDPAGPRAQAWTQICLEYSLTSSKSVFLRIMLDPAVDGYNHPQMLLPSQSVMTQTCFSTAMFAQESANGTWGTEVTTSEAQKLSVGMKFEYRLLGPLTVKHTANLKIKKISVK